MRASTHAFAPALASHFPTLKTPPSVVAFSVTSMCEVILCIQMDAVIFRGTCRLHVLRSRYYPGVIHLPPSFTDNIIVPAEMFG